MEASQWRPRLAVVLGYVLIALAFTWPLPLYLGSRLTGDPGGDTGVYVWNQWVFQHETAAGANPLSTERILALSQRVDLSQHNYTAFLNLLALPLIPLFGVITTFNIVFIAMTVLTALCGYALARLAFPTTRLEAFGAGLALAWAPAIVARTTGHFSLVAAAPLAAFTWCLIKAERTRRMSFAVLAGLSMAWAAFCDPYFAVFCLMIAGLYVASLVLEVTRRERLHRVPWVWVLDVVLLSLTGLIVGLAFGRGGRIELLGMNVSVRGLYTPVLILTVLFTVRLALIFRARVVAFPPAAWILRFAVITALACAGPLSPVLYGLGEGIVAGQFVSPPILWRSSPRGVDLLAYVHPNPNQFLSKWLLGDRQAADPVAFVEYTAAFSLVAVAIIGVAVVWARFRPKRGWWWLTLGFLALSLGPFVIVDGLNTAVPGPWALMRYVPLINAVRSPTRFAIVAALGLAMLLAGALAALGERWPQRRRAIGVAALLLLVVELVPAPRTLYSAEYSPLSQIIAADSRSVRVLNLPFGVRDGTSSAGNFSARYQFEQTLHGKPLIGGYLSRVSSRRLAAMTRRFPLIGSLVEMSEGRTLADAEVDAFRQQAHAFIKDADVGYVIVDDGFVTPQLKALAIDAFDLELLARDEALTLYRPRP
ncbi:MAG TPA: hypothetical protein VL263_20160 [Vicinamibacterales bacterium]|nr:hypothetical protein [Vicinamibacterales bacterium]